MKREEIVSLCDAAKQQLGSDYKVAKALDVPQTVISDWRAGRRNPQPEDIGLIADLAGMDGATWTLRAIVEKHEGTAKGDRLMKAVGKALLATGAMSVSAGASAHQIFGWTGEAMGYLIRCIVVLSGVRKFVRNDTAAAYTGGFFCLTDGGGVELSFGSASLLLPKHTSSRDRAEVTREMEYRLYRV